MLRAMPRTKREKTFASALVPFVIAMVRAGGKDPSPLERKYLRRRSAEGSALPEVTLEELGALLSDAAEMLGDPLFGLHCAQAMPRGGYGLLEFALRSAPTGRRAIEQLAEYGPLINPLVRWTLEVDGDEVALHHRAPRKGGVGRHGNMFTVARILAISREMLGPQLRPTRAWFAHEEKSCPPQLRDYLGTDDLSFGASSSGIAFRADALERTPEGSDPELNRALEAHASALLAQSGDDEVYERTRRALIELLPRGEASITRTAKRLHLTPRTLQRRLTGEGAAFTRLVTEVRKDQAKRHLARGDAPLSEIAAAVGYSDTAAFVRAFRRWTGTTPGRFREKQRAAGR